MFRLHSFGGSCWRLASCKKHLLHQSVMSRACAGVPRYRIGMTIPRRLAALVASALALAAAHGAGASKARTAQADVPDKSTASAGPQATTPDQAKAGVQPPPVALTQGRPAVFVSALALAAAAAVGAWILPSADSSPVPSQPKAGSLATLASSQIAACPLQSITAVADKTDGRLPLQAGVAGLVAADITSFIVLGREAAASGRSRDAEVAFLMACQVADKLKGIDSVESAQARYELGSHYARLALDGSPATAPNRDQLRSHAERFYSDSLHLYHFTYVQIREKPAFASQEPVPVQQTLAQGESLQPTPTAAPIPMFVNPAQDNAARSAEPARPSAKTTSKPPGPAVARAQPGKVAVRRAALPAPPRPSAALPPQPSFNCSKARSATEKMICSDAELARLDHELGQVYARAKRATTDRAAFQREQDRQWRMREALCRDRVCMLRWYAQRRYQLMAVIERRDQPKPLALRVGRLPDEIAGLYKGN
jgi:hypothetical protein